MASRASRSACIALASLALACGFVCGLERSSFAQDATNAKHELVDSDDFRVRISAALYLGKSHSPGALQSLTAALSDPNPTVRTAVAIALRKLGDPDAIGPLTRQLKREDAPATHSQIATAIESLHQAESPQPVATPTVKYAVKIGNMKNLTGVRGDALGNVMRQAAHTRAATIPGAVVVDDDTAAAQTHAPILVLDGVIVKMGQEKKSGGTVNFKAQVEFSVSKMPEHALKVALTGGATSIGTQSSLVSVSRINALEDQAIDGAVESAFNGCAVGLAQAVN
ncbi:MAG: HEAT repeat domain-containing protein [Polyangiaceae bacterium]